MLQAQVKLNIRVIKSNSPLSINKFSISLSLNMSQNPSLTVTYLGGKKKHYRFIQLQIKPTLFIVSI